MNNSKKTKNNSACIHISNKKKNKIRTNLLLIADTEIQNYLKKSIMKINTISPEKICKLYEDNYVVKLKQTVSPSKSHLTKNHAVKEDILKLKGDLSICHEDGISQENSKCNCCPTKSVFDLRRISISHKKFKIENILRNRTDLLSKHEKCDKNEINLLNSRRGSVIRSIIDETFDSKNSQLSQSKIISQSQLKNLNFSSKTKMILTASEKNIINIQHSFNSIQKLFKTNPLLDVSTLKNTNREDNTSMSKVDKELFDILECKGVDYNNKIEQIKRTSRRLSEFNSSIYSGSLKQKLDEENDERKLPIIRNDRAIFGSIKQSLLRKSITIKEVINEQCELNELDGYTKRSRTITSKDVLISSRMFQDLNTLLFNDMNTSGIQPTKVVRKSSSQNNSSKSSNNFSFNKSSDIDSLSDMQRISDLYIGNQINSSIKIKKNTNLNFQIKPKNDFFVLREDEKNNSILSLSVLCTNRKDNKESNEKVTNEDNSGKGIHTKNTKEFKEHNEDNIRYNIDHLNTSKEYKEGKEFKEDKEYKEDKEDKEGKEDKEKEDALSEINLFNVSLISDFSLNPSLLPTNGDQEKSTYVIPILKHSAKATFNYNNNYLKGLKQIKNDTNQNTLSSKSKKFDYSNKQLFNFGRNGVRMNTSKITDKDQLNLYYNINFNSALQKMTNIQKGKYGSQSPELKSSNNLIEWDEFSIDNSPLRILKIVPENDEMCFDSIYSPVSRTLDYPEFDSNTARVNPLNLNNDPFSSRGSKKQLKFNNNSINKEDITSFNFSKDYTEHSVISDNNSMSLNIDSKIV